MYKKLRLFDACSGIGGFSLALSEYFDTVAYCENDKICKSTLNKLICDGRLPDAHIHDDIRNIDVKKLQEAAPDAISAGFPCQDISIGGKGEGITGSRSNIIYDILNVVEKVDSIKILIFENSPMIVSRGLDTLLERFQNLHLTVTWCILGANQAGALHNRKRWFCVCTRNDPVLPALDIFDFTTVRWKEPPVELRLVKKNKHNNMRLHTLGNSVVPQCVKLAFELLISTHLIQTEQCRQVIPQKADKIIQSVRIGKGNLRTWGTPTRRLTHPHHNLKGYAFRERLLCNQIFWDNNTWKTFGCKNSITELANVYTMNAEWIEQFMGYDKKWSEYGV